MIKYRLTEKGIKKAKSPFLIYPGMRDVWAEDILRYLRGFQATGKTREKLQEHFKREWGVKGKVISNAMRYLINKGYLQGAVVAEKDIPTISKRNPQLSSKAPRITPKVGKLR